MAKKVANRLLGIRWFRVLRETKTGWTSVSKFPSYEQAERYAERDNKHTYCIEEIFE